MGFEFWVPGFGFRVRDLGLRVETWMMYVEWLDAGVASDVPV